ncbi:MAG: hypothetical protein ACPG51_20510, partial [Thiolinea sp.]
MKKIRHSSLRLQQGNTDKVYEVEIVERHSRNDERYLVNFRHGRYGAYLQEGSKTRSPVLFAEAEQLYNSVIVAQINKGFVVVSGDNPLPDTATETQNSQQVVQPALSVQSSNEDSSAISARQQAVFRKFMQHRAAHKTHDYQRCSRQIWRLGELEMTEAVPALTEELEKAMALREPNADQLIRLYSLIWSLGRCGGGRARPLLQELSVAEGKPPHIRRMAAHAHYHLLPQSEQQEALTHLYRALPDSLRTLLSGFTEGDTELVSHQAEQLLDWAQQHKANQPEISDQSESCFLTLYLQAKTSSGLRSVLLELCRTAPLEFGSVWLLRLFFKLAEFECDAEMLGILIPRFDASAARQYNWHQQPYEQKTYQRTTRDYFKRRGWRLLRRLGELGRADYVAIASAVLQQYDDKDSQPQTIRRYTWDGGYRAI